MPSRHQMFLWRAKQTCEPGDQPIVLVIISGSMVSKGFPFRSSANPVWLTKDVPPKFIRSLSDHHGGIPLLNR